MKDQRQTSSGERSDKESLECLTFSLDPVSPTLWWLAGLKRAETGSFGGGGSGDLIFPPPLGGGARPKGLGFPAPEGPPVRPADESIPDPPVGLGFTFIRIVSPSYSSKHCRVSSIQNENQRYNSSQTNGAQRQVEKITTLRVAKKTKFGGYLENVLSVTIKIVILHEAKRKQTWKCTLTQKLGTTHHTRSNNL